MTTLEILHVLQSEIHSAVFATLDEQGLPQTCAASEKNGAQPCRGKIAYGTSILGDVSQSEKKGGEALHCSPL